MQFFEEHFVAFWCASLARGCLLYSTQKRMFKNAMSAWTSQLSCLSRSRSIDRASGNRCEESQENVDNKNAAAQFWGMLDCLVAVSR
jgi:hypothetical protein